MALVMLQEKSSHGYGLRERIAELGFERVNSGTLYRTLRQMEKEGLCESEWDTSNNGPACRVYSVTNDGEAYLDSWAEGYKKYQLTLDTFNLHIHVGNSQPVSVVGQKGPEVSVKT